MAQHALSTDPRGLKRICLSCSTRFYDMNKRPIMCPNCSTEFSGEIKIKTRRGRLSPTDIIEDDVAPGVVLPGVGVVQAVGAHVRGEGDVGEGDGLETRLGHS